MRVATDSARLSSQYLGGGGGGRKGRRESREKREEEREREGINEWNCIS